MAAQQANINLQYQQQLQQQHEQQLQQQQQQQQQLNAQDPQRRRKRMLPVKKTFPTTVSPGMRDRQARGKNTHREHEDDVTDDDEGDDDEAEEEEGDGKLEGHRGLEEEEEDDDDEEEEDEEDAEEKTNSSSFSYRSEPFETRERRAYALAVLDRPEQLMMYANTTNDSVAGQRVRFTRMMCGFDDDIDWRNNSHYKAALIAAKERQMKMRRGASIPRGF